MIYRAPSDMASCYHCGEELEFINNGSGPIPIHPSGSCGGRGGYGSGRTYSTFRSTSDGQVFEFPFVLYPSYVNPNARCPVCGASVYFYQSPYGGRVFFDELGPPWPKHPCTDNPVVRRHLATAEGRRDCLVASTAPTPGSESHVDKEAENQSGNRKTAISPTAWQNGGWMPYIVTKLIPRPIGIEAEGTLFVSPTGQPIQFRIEQASADARFYRRQGDLLLGFGLVQNTGPILSALNECPVMLKMDPDLKRLTMSSFILTRDGNPEEITLTVNGTKIPKT